MFQLPLMPIRRPVNLRVEFALLAVLACLWGSSYLLITVALATIPPITLMAVRVTLAAMFLFIVRGEQRSATVLIGLTVTIIGVARINGPARRRAPALS